MLYVVWNVWNEIDNLPNSVSAVEKTVGGDVCKHVFVDGRYRDYPGRGWLSTDGTPGFCLDAGTYLPTEKLDENEKRNHGLAFVDTVAMDEDWVLILDPDEELQALAEPPPGTDVGIISFMWDSDGEARDRARLFRWKPGLRYKGRHFTVYDGEDLFASLTGPGLLVGFGRHHNTTRSKKREKAKAVYYERLVEKEKGLPR